MNLLFQRGVGDTTVLRLPAVRAGLASCTILVRLPFAANAGVDEAFYLVVARQWLEGQPPYAGSFDVKPPLLFAAAFGAVFATAFGLYLFGRRFLGELAGPVFHPLQRLCDFAFPGAPPLSRKRLKAVPPSSSS